MNKWIIAMCAAGGLTAAAVAWAGPGEGGEFRGGGPGGERGHQGPGRGVEAMLQNPEIAKEAGVTDEQIAAIKKAAYENRKNLIKLRGDVELARLEVRNLMQADSVDKEAVMAAVDNAGKATIELRKAQIGFMLQVKEIVGKDAVQKMRQHFREARQDRGGPEGRENRGRDDSRGDERGPGRGPGVGQNDNQEGAPWMQDEMMPPPDEMDEDITAI